MYSMEIDNAGQTLNVWRPREGRRIRFGEYQNNGKFKIQRGGLFYVYSQVSHILTTVLIIKLNKIM